jgi:hypothetical protein
LRDGEIRYRYDIALTHTPRLVSPTTNSLAPFENNGICLDTSHINHSCISNFMVL